MTAQSTALVETDAIYHLQEIKKKKRADRRLKWMFWSELAAGALLDPSSRNSNPE